MNRLILKNLTIRARDKGATPIVADINLEMGDGQILGLLGPNGCGKTSVIRAIAGFLPSDTASGNSFRRWRVQWGNESRRMSGEIWIDGQDVTGLPPGDRGIALVPQNLALYPDKTVIENIAFPLQARGVKKQESFSQATQMSKWLGIGDILTRRPSEISGGQQQRVAIGRALIGQPRLVLLDEPLASLDTLSKGEMLNFISRTLRERGASAIYVTHDPAEATLLCDRVAFINNHRVQQIAAPADAFSKPATLFVARMFSGFTNAVKGRLSNHGLFTPSGGEGQWNLSLLGTDQFNPDQEFWLAGRPYAFQISGAGGQGVKGKIIDRLTLNGVPYARVEIANGTYVMCRDLDTPGNFEVTVTLDEKRGNDLRLFNEEEAVIIYGLKPSEASPLIPA